MPLVTAALNLPSARARGATHVRHRATEIASPAAALFWSVRPRALRLRRMLPLLCLLASAAGSSSTTFTASCSSRTDCSNELQAAIYSGAPTIRVPDLGFPWRVCKVKGQAMDGLMINISNTVLILDPGVIIEAAPGCFGSLKDPNSTATLFSTRNHGPHACYPDFLGAPACSNNLTILGYGAMLRMRKYDYMNATIYARNAYRGGLYVYRASNFAAFGLTVTLTGGDGLYVHECANCHFADLNLTDNFRQACSVIAARDTVFDNCSFLNTGMTGGIAPQAGVDFEPNSPADYLTNLTLRNCRSENNVGGGFMLSYGNLNNHSEPISVSFENCIVDGKTNDNNYGLYAYGLPGYPDNTTNAVNGTISWRGGSISNTRLCSVAVDVPVCSGMTVYIQDLEINGTRVRSVGPFATSPVVVGMWAGDTNHGLRKPSGEPCALATELFICFTAQRPTHGQPGRIDLLVSSCIGFLTRCPPFRAGHLQKCHRPRQYQAAILASQCHV